MTIETLLGKLLGDWKLESSENFEEYMKAVDVGLVTRKLGASSKPNVKIFVEGDEVVLKTEAPLKTHVLKFKLGQEFQETTADGRKPMTTISMEGGKLVQKQGGSGVVASTITREVDDQERLVCTLEGKGVTSKRIYSRIV